MRPYWLPLLLAACAGDKSGDTGGTGDTATPPGDDDDDTAAACTPLEAGGWSMDGSCFGMLMTATLTVEADGCSFTFSNWNMAMSVPVGGSVSGTDVTLDWADKGGCTGT